MMNMLLLMRMFLMMAMLISMMLMKRMLMMKKMLLMMLKRMLETLSSELISCSMLLMSDFIRWS